MFRNNATTPKKKKEKRYLTTREYTNVLARDERKRIIFRVRTGGCFSLESFYVVSVAHVVVQKKNDHQDLEDLEERRRWLFCHPRALLPVGSLEEEEVVVVGRRKRRSDAADDDDDEKE